MRTNAVKNTIICDSLDEIIKIQIATRLICEGIYLNERNIDCLVLLAKLKFVDKDEFVTMCKKKGLMSRKDVIEDFIKKSIKSEIIKIHDKNIISFKYETLTESPILCINHIIYTGNETKG